MEFNYASGSNMKSDCGNNTRKMLYKPGLFLLAFIISLLSLANGIDLRSIDSLSRQLAVKKSDTSRIQTNLLLSKAYATSGLKKYDSALFCLNEALQLSLQLKYNRWLYDIYSENSVLLNSSGNFSLALEYYFKMLKLLDEESSKTDFEIKRKTRYASLYAQIGLCYFSMEKQKKAL